MPRPCVQPRWLVLNCSVTALEPYCISLLLQQRRGNPTVDTTACTAPSRFVARCAHHCARSSFSHCFHRFFLIWVAPDSISGTACTPRDIRPPSLAATSPLSNISSTTSSSLSQPRRRLRSLRPPARRAPTAARLTSGPALRPLLDGEKEEEGTPDDSQSSAAEGPYSSPSPAEEEGRVPDRSSLASPGLVRTTRPATSKTLSIHSRSSYEGAVSPATAEAP